MARRYYNKRDRYGRWSNGSNRAAPHRATYRKQSKGQRYAAYQTRVAAQKKATRNKRLKTAAAVGLVAAGAVVAYKMNTRANQGPKGYRSLGEFGTGNINRTGKIATRAGAQGFAPSAPIKSQGPKVPASGGVPTLPKAIKMATSAMTGVTAAKKLIPPGAVSAKSKDHTIDQSKYLAVGAKGTPYKNQRHANIGGFKVDSKAKGSSNGLPQASKANAVPVSEATPATARKASGASARRRPTTPIIDPMDLKEVKTSYGGNYSDVGTREIIRHKVVDSTGGVDIARQAIAQLKEKPVNKGGRPKKNKLSGTTVKNEWGQEVSAAKMKRTAARSAAAVDAAKELLGKQGGGQADYIDAIFEKFSSGGKVSAGDRRLLRKEGLID